MGAWLRSASVAALAGVAVLFAPGAQAEAALDPAAGRTISVLSYNVHGLFRLAAKDDPRDRMPTIGWLASRYDVALFQEDFEYHSELAQQMPASNGHRGNGLGWDLRLWAGKLLLLPGVVLVPNFSPPYGAGLSSFVVNGLDVPDGVAKAPYRRCNGWIGENGDCWARKGWLRVRVRTAEGAEIDVYNTHAEAGPSERSVEVRRSHLVELADAVERLSAGRAVIVAGDYNVSTARPGDREMLAEFRERLALRDSGAGPETPFWRERDYILYREGDAVALAVEAAGEASEFVSGRRALSDHPALYARFRATPVEGP